MKDLASANRYYIIRKTKDVDKALTKIAAGIIHQTTPAKPATPESETEAPKPNPNAPEDAAKLGTHRYYVYDRHSTWADAKAYCESLGGHLATISSQEQNDLVFKLMVDQGYRSAYFGLSDEEKYGVYKWVTGEPVTYTNWEKGEPNHLGGREHYGMFYSRFANGFWNDGDFGQRTVGLDTAFICEWD